jgi:DNA-binding NarL/FixJ family response regulator
MRGLESAVLADPSFRVVDQEVEEHELEAVVARFRPTVLIVSEDVQLELLEHLRVVQSKTEIVVFAHDPRVAVGLALLAAEMSCLASSVSEPNLHQSLHLAASGRKSFLARSGTRVGLSAELGGETLTRREQEVLAGIAREDSYEEIARGLGIGRRTVEAHAAALRSKLGVSKRGELNGIQLPPSFAARLTVRRS